MQGVPFLKIGKITRQAGGHRVISNIELDLQPDTKHVQGEIIDKRGSNTFAETQSILVLNVLERGKRTEPEAQVYGRQIKRLGFKKLYPPTSAGTG